MVNADQSLMSGKNVYFNGHVFKDRAHWASLPPGRKNKMDLFPEQYISNMFLQKEQKKKKRDLQHCHASSIFHVWFHADSFACSFFQTLPSRFPSYLFFPLKRVMASHDSCVFIWGEMMFIFYILEIRHAWISSRLKCLCSASLVCDRSCSVHTLMFPPNWSGVIKAV